MVIVAAATAQRWAVFFVAMAITGVLAVVVYVILQRRGDRIRAADIDPRIVSDVMTVEFRGSANDLLDVLRDTASSVNASDVSVDESASKLTMQTPANLRTWGQYLQIDVKEQTEHWTLKFQSWPSRDRQTADTHAGGRKAIKKFENALLGKLEKLDTP